MTHSLEEGSVLSRLIDLVHRQGGVDFRPYRASTLLKRVQWRMQQEKLGSIEALLQRAEADPDCLIRLTRSLTLHVTTLFRDADFFRDVREQVVPRLQTYARPRLWVAGCSTGAELYSYCIVLAEAGLLGRCQIYATDLSESALAQARSGVLDAGVWDDYWSNYRSAGGCGDLGHFFAGSGDARVFDARLLTNVVFSLHNLVSDASFNEFQAVSCRNVLIYLDAQAQARVLQLLHDSLCPLGFLGLGKGESITASPHREDYRMFASSHCLYRRCC